MFKRLFLLLFIMFELHAIEIDKKYPNYSYVFHEFDVDHAYIYDETFKQFTKKNENFLHQFYRASLKKGKEVLPTMKGLLAKQGVSDLFIYLSMIESGFSNNAISPKKAVGLWQFMPATAKQYDLEVCETYDERCDTTSSTAAAIRYLNKLYKDFGKWYLAAMAYNCGEGCLNKAIARARTDDLSVLTSEKERYLPKETREYIRKILLIAMIGESGNISYEGSSSDFVDVEVDTGSDLKMIAESLKLEYKFLKKINPKIKGRYIPKRDTRAKYTIQIPIEKIFSFYLQYELDTGNKALKPHLISHYVKLGETLESIAKVYESSILEIEKANHLTNEYLTLDQLLVIPVTQKVFEKVTRNN